MSKTYPVVLAVMLAACQLGDERDPLDSETQSLTPEERGRDIWFNNTYGGEKFFSLVLPYHPDPLRRIRIGFQEVVDTPRSMRFDVWGVINDPDCEANPEGGMDLCPDPESSGVIGIRFKGPSPAGDGTNAFGAACAACHAGFDPVTPPDDPNDPEWDNIHATIGNQYLDFGAIFGANLAPTDVRALMFAAWPNGAVDTTLLFSDNIMNAGTVTAFWEHPNRPTFDVGMDVPKLRNGQGGDDDVGGDLATLRVYTNIGVCFFECVAGPATSGVPIDIDTCRATCPDFPPQQDLDDVGAFLATHTAPQLPGYESRLLSGLGKLVFNAQCASCHKNTGDQNRVLSNDEVIALADDPANTTNACRSLTSNWEEGKLWAQFSSDVYKDRIAAGDRGYRVMPLSGIWSTPPLLHNQSIGEVAPADASPWTRASYFWSAMSELLSDDRAPKINVTPIDLPGIPAGTPLAYVFSRDPTTGQVLCDDVIENRGHHYGAGLPGWAKVLLVYYLQFQ